MLSNFHVHLGISVFIHLVYALRSNIAHGNNYEIDSSLKNFVRVNEFLELVVVKLLRFALYNQVLVEGLKEC